jgi:Zn-dependent protease with chaperone function
MDFFQAQDTARGRTRLLVVLFSAAVAAIIIAIYAVVHLALGPGPGAPIDPLLLTLVAVVTIVLVSAGSGARTMQLRKGGGVVAEMLGGRRVSPGTSDEHERRLVNVVEEMAIASGMSVPAIYVLDGEDGINAFAAGYTLDDAAVAVTRGALHSLNRSELQGVIAHEFSHILNGDMRLNIRLIGLLYGILLLAIVGRGLLRGGAMRGGRRGRGGGGAQAAAIGIGLIVVGYIGVFFGRLIQAAVSRQREYLADASAVQFTRDADGLAGALKKIGGLSAGSRIVDHHAAEASHLFFANGMARPFATLFATHPPLADRIHRLDPSFEGKPARRRRAPTAGAAGTAFATPPLEPVRVSGERAATSSIAAPAGAAAAVPPGITAPGLIGSIGTPGPEHIAYAHQLIDSLPRAVIDAAHDATGAQALLCALLLPDPAAVADAARAAVVELGGEDMARHALELAAEVKRAGEAARLPLLDLLMPALRELPGERRTAVQRAAERLMRADGRIDMFELALYHVLGRQLAQDRNMAAARGGERSIAALRHEAQLVLSAVAWSGARDATAARAAFAEGAANLGDVGRVLNLAERGQIRIAAVDDALERLRGAAAGVRRRVVEACTHVVAHDGHVQLRETEILRAVSEALDCPMPPPPITRPAAGAPA